MRAYTLKQMKNLGICVDEYKINEFEGVFVARLDHKRWGKNRNVLAYFTFKNGNKVVTSAWWENDYLGIPEIEEGAMLILTFKKAKNGGVYLRKVERYEKN